MLISMPTCTSTIFGVFQAIRDSQVSGTIAAVKLLSAHIAGGDGRDAARSPVIVDCWTQNGDYPMTPAKQYFQRRRRSVTRRSDRLPDRPACHERDHWHRGSR